MIIRIKQVFLLLLIIMLPAMSHANNAIFKIQLEPESSGSPKQMGLYDMPSEHFFVITNQSHHDMKNMTYALSNHLTKNPSKSNCGSILKKNRAVDWRPFFVQIKSVCLMVS